MLEMEINGGSSTRRERGDTATDIDVERESEVERECNKALLFFPFTSGQKREENV